MKHIRSRTLGACALVAFVALNPAQVVPAFEAVQPDILGTGGALVNAWGDFDGDGNLDLFVGFNGTPNRLYRYADGKFADVAVTAGLAEARPTRAAAWGDYDADGDLDLFVGLAPGAGGVHRLFRNDRGVFTDVTAAAQLTLATGAVRQPVWIDVDGDADLDLFVGFRDRANALFLNERGTFTDVAVQRNIADPRKTVGAVWFDFDEDNDFDLVVANMDGHENAIYRNDGSTFSACINVSATAPAARLRETDSLKTRGACVIRTVNSRGDSAHIGWGGRAAGDSTNGSVRVCSADVNNDGRLDLFFANYGPNGLFLNRGGGTFEDVSSAWGIAIDSRYDTCVFDDFDNDGKIDLYVNGTVGSGRNYRDHLFRNTGTAFADVSPPNIVGLNADHGAEWADYDRDGAVDLALTGQAANGTHQVFRNLLPAADAARSLSVRVVDAQGHATCAGAVVRLYAAGTRTVIGTRIVDAGSGYNAQNSSPLHFGLPANAPVDVEVTFPSRGAPAPARVEQINAASYRGRDLVVTLRR